MDLAILRRTAAEIAAAAIYELYPDVGFLGGSETSNGFFYDFIFPHPIHTHLIEEKMKQVVRERRPIRTLEMVSYSASELLKSKGLLDRLEELENKERSELVELVQIADFCDLSQGPHLKNTAELAAFKISIEKQPHQKVRLNGFCHRSKEELKKYLKQVQSYIDPHLLGQEKGFWKGPIWLSKGIALREKLIQFLKRYWFAEALEVEAPSQMDRWELYRSLNAPKVVEQLHQAPNDTRLQVCFLGADTERMNSCLHLIGKTLTILGFDHSAILMGNETHFVVLDGLGRSQSLVYAEKNGREFCFCVEVEKVLLQMIEKNLMGLLENQ